MFKEVQNNLFAVGSLKVGQITRWHSERLGDAAVIGNDKPLIRSIEQFFNSNNRKNEEELIGWMRAVKSEYGYYNVLLIDTMSKVRITLLPSDSMPGDICLNEMRQILPERRIIMTDLHTSSVLPIIHIDIIIPLFDSINNKMNSVGSVVLRIDPANILFPLIQSWPSASKTSETLLLRKEGDSILYLNELRHKANTALKFKLSHKTENLLAAKAIHGFEGVAEGIDYRNVPVIGSIHKIPDLPWYLVAKVDSDEVLSPLIRYIVLIIIVIVLLLLINASVFGFWIWKQRISSYKKQVKDANEIHELEERFSTAFRMSPVSITISSMNDNKFINVNNTFLSDMEYSREEVVGRTARELGIWAVEDERFRIIDQLEQNRNIFGKVLSFKSKSGKIIPVLTSMSVIKVNNELCNLSTGINLTAIRKAEELLMQSEELYQKLFANMLNGFAYCKMIYKNGLPHDFIYLKVNKAFESLTGLINVEGKKVSEVIPGIQKADQGLLERYGRVVSTGKPEVFENYVESLSMWFSISAYCPLEEHFVAIFDVITERKLAEEALHKLNDDLERRVSHRTEQLEASNRELESFSYSVSHDLRAPLRSVHGFTEILRHEYGNVLDDEGRRICGIISSSATQMGGLIDDLLSFSRIGKSTMNATVIDMNKMAGLVFDSMTSPIERERINLHIEKMPDSHGDVTLIGQVWTNLISNAIKYSSKNKISEIKIGSDFNGNTTTYYIKDNGVGFDQKYSHKLFGVFQRLHSEAEFEGNGVGLAIVQRIILKHGGKVWAEGEVGQGATFYFSLPLNGVDSLIPKPHDI